MDEAQVALQQLGPLTVTVGGLGKFSTRVIYLSVQLTAADKGCIGEGPVQGEQGAEKGLLPGGDAVHT